MKNLKTISIYLIAPILTLVVFTVLFQLWKIDLTQPVFDYSEDTLFSFLIIKQIVETGWVFSNEFTGFPQLDGKFYLHDFPIGADAFNFLIIKILSYFSSNIFLIANCFFIITFTLISFTSFVALRSVKISNFTAVLISILFAFLSYHFYRNIWHMLLSNYAVIPLSVMVALWIMAGKIELLGINKQNQFSLTTNRYFYCSFLITIFAATNGAYYALYSLLIFIFAWFLSGFEKEKFLSLKIFPVITICSAMLIVMLALYMPSIIYWAAHGPNGAIASRHSGDSVIFGLRISNLFIPPENSYLQYFRNLRTVFTEISHERESSAEYLGIMAGSGFLFLLLWMIAKNFGEKKNSFLQKTIKKLSLRNEENELISRLAGLNLVTVLFATMGGFVMFFAASFPLLRSHARFMVFVAFFSFTLVAIIFDKIIEKKIFNQKYLAHILLVVITVISLFDQVGKVSAQTAQTEKMKSRFVVDKDFVERVEADLPKGQIFILPVYGFPEADGDSYESLVGYLHSKELRWSYPAITKRKSNLWQKEVEKLEFNAFISQIKKSGFNAVFINRVHYAFYLKDDWKKVRMMENNLRKIAKKPAIFSKDLRLVLFEI
jgi:phosphoglycerol transferase